MYVLVVAKSLCNFCRTGDVMFVCMFCVWGEVISVTACSVLFIWFLAQVLFFWLLTQLVVMGSSGR